MNIRAMGWVGIWLFFASPSALASKVIQLGPSRTIQSADLVLTIEITKRQKTPIDCALREEFEIKPGKIHHGSVNPAATGYHFSITHIIQHKPKSPYSHCPRVSYEIAPQSSDLAAGSRVLATAVFQKTTKTYLITSTFELSRLDELRTYFH
jgi:hypothetical protein|tara:strand:- start:5 stop:460 length:456 start_codon:yes stop_codon:yes gene_type:complete